MHTGLPWKQPLGTRGLARYPGGIEHIRTLLARSHGPISSTCRHNRRCRFRCRLHCRFIPVAAYDDSYNGLADGFPEGERIASHFARAEDRVLFMANHGVISVRACALYPRC